jgi:hypothetical protein
LAFDIWDSKTGHRPLDIDRVGQIRLVNRVYRWQAN